MARPTRTSYSSANSKNHQNLYLLIHKRAKNRLQIRMDIKKSARTSVIIRCSHVDCTISKKSSAHPKQPTPVQSGSSIWAVSSFKMDWWRDRSDILWNVKQAQKLSKSRDSNMNFIAIWLYSYFKKYNDSCSFPLLTNLRTRLSSARRTMKTATNSAPLLTISRTIARRGSVVFCVAFAYTYLLQTDPSGQSPKLDTAS